MSRSSRDDDQVFVVLMGSRNRAPDPNSEVSNAFLGVLAVAIVLMVFVGLVNDADRRRFRQWQSVPTTQLQPVLQMPDSIYTATDDSVR